VGKVDPVQLPFLDTASLMEIVKEEHGIPASEHGVLSSDWQARFAGIARLYGDAALATFAHSTVAIVGLGGVGAWVAEALARSGVGRLRLVDLDDICLTNTNRQIHALASTIGQSKVQAMARRLQDINPELKLDCREQFYTEATAEAFFAEPADLVVDAIDSVRQKAHLLAACRERGSTVITIGGAGGRLDPTRIKTADLSRSEGDRLLMLVRKKLRSAYRFPRVGKGRFRIPCVYSDEPPRFPLGDGKVCMDRPENTGSGLTCDNGLGSATHVTASMAFFATSLALEKLLKIAHDRTGNALDD
jgi:tRNA A37 threonylcarbamoyladenosine dehydratase